MNDFSPTRLPVGLHADVPEEVYHADPAPEPSASASILKLLFNQSPAHAWTAHPRLNPAWEPSAGSEAKDRGTILHSLILGTPPRFQVFNFDSWRGKAAEIRDATRAAGMIPMLEHKMEEIHTTADGVRRRIREHFPELDAALRDPDTMKEATIICRINGVMCKVRVDILPPARYGFVGDLKFTGLANPPSEYERTLRREYRFQADLYPRAVAAVRGDEPEFRFFTFETEAPHAGAAYRFVGMAQERNRARTDAALAQWSACLTANEWPAYSSLLHAVDDEPWEDRQDEARVLRSSAAAQVSTGLIARLHRISAEMGGPLR